MSSRDRDPRVLVVAQAWVGDLVLSQILYVLLKRRRPDFSIDVVAPSWAAALLARMPQVARHIALDVRRGQLGLWRRWAAARRLDAEYRRAIVIPRSAKAAALPWVAGIRKRVGFGPGTRAGLINDPRPRPPDARTRMARLASRQIIDPAFLPRPKLAINPEEAASVPREWKIDPGEPMVGLMPGAAYGPAKEWGAKSFARLAAMLAARGRRVCVIGAPGDRPLGETIVRAAPRHAINLCGETSLEQAILLISRLTVAVCNDSGLMHVAAAVDTPVVGIYGPTSPDTHPPLTDARRILSVEVPCSPCHRRACPYQSHACMARITPERALEAAMALLPE